MNREPCLRRPQRVLPDVGPQKKKKRKMGGKRWFILFLYLIFIDWVKYFYSVFATQWFAENINIYIMWRH